MKTDKEFRDSAKRTLSESDYVLIRVMFRALLIIMILGVITAFSGMAYKKWAINKNREIFKQSTSYNESASNFIAKSLREYNTATSPTEKKAIMNYVVLRYPNIDYDELENESIREFYKKCLIGE
jgi:hypothetical protein